MADIWGAFTTGNFFYFFIVVGIFAIGDFFGILTKARISSVFVVLFLFLVGFLTKVLPPNIIGLAGLAEFGKMAAAILIFHMGTIIDLKQLAREWHTVLTAVLSMVASFAVSPIIGIKSAIVAIPVLNGGIVSTQIMSEAAAKLGLVIPAALGVILYAIKKFAGSYPASLFGVREAKDILEDYRKNKKDIVVERDDKKSISQEKRFCGEI